MTVTATPGTPGTSAQAPAKVRSTHPIGSLLRQWGVLAPTVVLLLVSIFFVDNFATKSNISDLLTTMTFVGFVAVGMTFVVASGHFVDLSVVTQMGVAAVCVVALQPHGLIVALLAGLGLCVVFGLINGFAVAVLKGNGVIVTLATMTIGMGVLTLATQSTLYQGQSSAFASFGTARFGVIPAGFLLLILAMVIAHIALKYTSFGYHVKYTGSSPRFAQVSGIPAVRTVILCFVIVAACAWAAGVLLAGFSNTGVASVGTGYEFDALAAVVIGGNSLFGGRASIARTALGLLLVSLISNVLLLVGMSFDAQTVTKGLVIIAAVVIDALANRRNSKVIS